MSNLVKPYEISVWDDIWDSGEGKFIEKKLLVIGTDEMTSLNRALEPVLTRNVNGTKKFSFKMYKRYIDRETGEEVHNLFIDCLINERKIKLKYGVDDEGKDKWYDFIIKNVNETSTTYLYQFDLEDAIVQELSKNGFGVTLDAQLNNNMGTADQLAEKVLADTDWTVAGSDKLVQEVKEHLVYVSYIQDPQPETLKIYMLKNSGDNYDSEGVEEVQMNNFQLKGKKVLAFYSSCTGTPHRFQFIILPDYIETNEDNVIINKDCQYFIEYDPEHYTVENEEYGFKLPTGWSVQDQGDVETDDKDTTVSYKYRGNRFGYAQQAVYLPKLDRYVNKYTHNTYGNIYGYVDNEYISPVLMTNLISNTGFKNTSGWKGVGYGTPKQGVNKPESTDKPLVENVYGTKEGNFESALDRLSVGKLGNDTSIYEAYMKLTFPKKQENIDRGYIPAVINSGPFDNRTLIGKITEGDEWALYVEGRTPDDLTGLEFTLEESEYTSGSGCYVPVTNKKIEFTSVGTAGPQSAKIFTFAKCDYNEKTFKKQMKLRLVVTHGGERATESIHYIKTIELHKVVRDKDNNIIRLNTQAAKTDEGVVNTKYFYFTKDAYDTATTRDEIEYIHTADKAEPRAYKPVYNAGAEKIRSVTAKESNYFNILQSIAETFEAWLDLKITRDANGAVTGKQVSFKKYSGGDNYAAFRYGVNLKDITRTTESKQIVTKLIVKNNSNELALNKFCTIQRAPSNVSGENYIYDFQYYHNNGLLNADDYLNELYYTQGAQGPDRDGYKNEEETPTNIKGYFPRLKALNNRLVEINEQMSGLSQELLQLKAEREVAEAAYEAAESGIEQTSEDFEILTGFSIDAYNIENISIIVGYDRVDSFEIPQTVNSQNKHKLVYSTQPDENGPTYSIIPTIKKQSDGQYKLSCTATRSWTQQGGGTGTYKVIRAVYYICAKIGGKYKYIAQNIKVEFEGFSGKKITQESKKISDAIITSVDTTRSDVNKLLTEYLTYQQEKTKSENEKTRLAALIDGDDGKQKQYDTLKQEFEDIRDNQKLPLNKAFFQKYSRFIQEGTWIDEQYVDDEKYYNDAQTVLYNSCYPKVGYTINVLSLSKMPGYEFFVFDVGEKTYAEDEEFFGTDENGYPNRTEIIITEMSEHLDNPSADSIKVQNFKNQFQDLFQKITATVQQTQYNEGTYRKGAALVEASSAKKNEFLLDSLSDPASVLSNAGQNEVVWDNAGITVTNKNNRSEQLRLVSSGIMFSTDSESGPKWSTGITPQGISANKILAGSINTGEISLMNGKDTSFLWNAFGINAFDYEIENGTVTSVNKSRFVRFDKNGIYGINGMANADAWKPNSPNEVDEKATFALTWEGLKVTGNTDNGNNVVARIGKSTDNIINITNNGSPIFTVSNAGDAVFAGELSAATGTFSGSVRIGDNNDIFLNPAGETIGEKSIIFKAGDDFMVSESGEMYASSGKIANFEISKTKVERDGNGWKLSSASSNIYDFYKIWGQYNTPGSTSIDGEVGLSSGGSWAFWAGRSADGYGTYAPTRIGHWGDINTQVLRVKPHALDNLAKPSTFDEKHSNGTGAKVGFTSNGSDKNSVFGTIRYNCVKGHKYKMIFRAHQFVSETTTERTQYFYTNLYNSEANTIDTTHIKVIPWTYKEKIDNEGKGYNLSTACYYYVICFDTTTWDTDKPGNIRFWRNDQDESTGNDSDVHIYDIMIFEDDNDLYLPDANEANQVYLYFSPDKTMSENFSIDYGVRNSTNNQLETPGTIIPYNTLEKHYHIKQRPYWMRVEYGDWQFTAEGGTLDLTGVVLNDIQAKTGTIAGWVITEEVRNGETFRNIHQHTTDSNGNICGTGIQPPGSGAWSFAAGYTDYYAWASAPFRVSHKGELYCSRATLTWDDNNYDCSMTFGDESSFYSTNYSGILLKAVNKGTAGASRKSLSISLNCNRSSGEIAELHPTLIYSQGYLATASLKFEGYKNPDDGKYYTSGKLAGNWHFQGSYHDSDKNVKKDIETLKTNFENFFDFLSPVSYKYVNGTSGRTHIAQEVEQSLINAKLTTKDFSGIAIEEQDGQLQYYLNYIEFIALNTDQIQKLKPRVSTLEQTILNYESRISNLETEIQNLKSTQNSDII